MKPSLPDVARAKLSRADEAQLTELYVRGTPANTLRAYERDLLYITAWKSASFDLELLWPESEAVALRFILDHSRDLRQAGAEDHGRITADALIAMGLRRDLACPAPATLDRRIATWRALHRMRNLPSPFEAPVLRQARSKARRANARTAQHKSKHPITRDVLEAMLATCEMSSRGLRDAALLSTGWASGGRRRSEIAGLRNKDVHMDDFAAKGIIRLDIQGTKTTERGATPKLVLSGRPARLLLKWRDHAQIDTGPLFRAISRTGRVLERGLSPAGIAHVVKHRLEQAGYDKQYASAHGLRSGFLTQAALDGAPVQAAMRLSLHRSVKQAYAYYDDVDIVMNPAATLLD